MGAAVVLTALGVATTHLILGEIPEKKENLGWVDSNPEKIKPDSFKTFYPKRSSIVGLKAALERISGGNIEFALGYGSAFNNDAAPDSLMDILTIVRNPEEFYSHLLQVGGIKLGTIGSARFHAGWNKKKTNFYIGELELGGIKRGIKLAVIGHDQFLQHARGGRPDVMKRGAGKGYLYLSGRLQKAGLVPLYSEANDSEQKEINLAINQSRIDGVLLTLGLMPEQFSFDDFALSYVGLSYAADRRVERDNKAESLFRNNEDEYRRMLKPILTQILIAKMLQVSIIRDERYRKVVSLPKEVVQEWLKECAQHSFRVNFFQNIWTMSPVNGISYALAKVKRVRLSSAPGSDKFIIHAS